MTIIYLTNTALTTWTVPADWSNTNQIETWGAGGGSASAGAGGGGGAYSSVSNIAGLSGTLTIQIGAAAVRSAGGDTWFNGASLAASSVGAKGGAAASGTAGGAGGAAASGIGTTKNSGGAGAGFANGLDPGGGGGAAGPSGNGGAGGGDSASNVGGGGGGASNGGAAGNAATATSGGAGGGAAGGAGGTAGAHNGGNGGGGSGGGGGYAVFAVGGAFGNGGDGGGDQDHGGGGAGAGGSNLNGGLGAGGLGGFPGGGAGFDANGNNLAGNGQIKITYTSMSVASAIIVSTAGHPALARDAGSAEIVDKINRMQKGETNALTPTFTLSTGTTSTALTSAQIGPNSFIEFMPQTANAAAALTSLYVTNRLKGKATVNHPNNTQTDRSYTIVIFT